jgi:hypothetical protein
LAEPISLTNSPNVRFTDLKRPRRLAAAPKDRATLPNALPKLLE